MDIMRDERDEGMAYVHLRNEKKGFKRDVEIYIDEAGLTIHVRDDGLLQRRYIILEPEEMQVLASMLTPQPERYRPGRKHTFSVEETWAIIERYLRGDISQAKLAQQYGVHTETIGRVIRRARKAGLLPTL